MTSSRRPEQDSFPRSEGAHEHQETGFGTFRFIRYDQPNVAQQPGARPCSIVALALLHRPGVVSVARSRRRGIGGFLSSIFSDRTESLAGEDRWRRSEWKRALVGTVIVALGIAILEGIFRLTHFQTFRTGVILVSLILTAGFPQMACDSVAPFLRPRISFVDGHVAIRGERLTPLGISRATCFSWPSLCSSSFPGSSRMSWCAPFTSP